ncbi:MAG TPA: sensor histidine kinase [Acidimicrobiales bacterium]|nr:sensor histidine kinase [Acidimicrobiales bacterium]
MISATLIAPPEPAHGFRHEAFMYAGDSEFLEGTVAFIEGGLEAGEPVLVVEPAAKLDMLRDALGPSVDEVHFADMAAVGRNPARIIPAWEEFVRKYPDRRLRGIGEPIGPQRGPDELDECHLHESLLNVAFDGGRPWWLLCPYDVTALPPEVVEEARRTHPFVHDGNGQRPSDDYRPVDVGAPFDRPLSDPPGQPVEMPFAARSLHDVRGVVSRLANRAGLGPEETAYFVLAVNEVAANSVRHGGGGGILRIWDQGDSLTCEIRDSGHIGEPLAGRRPPGLEDENGRGLWLANQVCDLVQVHSSVAGTVVRLHMRLL